VAGVQDASSRSPNNVRVWNHGRVGSGRGRQEQVDGEAVEVC
jgi:hypothetical protein